MPSCTGSCPTGTQHLLCWSGPRRTSRVASLRTSRTYNSSRSSQSPARTYDSSPSSQSPAPTRPILLCLAEPRLRWIVRTFATQSPDSTGPNSCHSNFLHVVVKSRHRTRIMVSAPLPLSLHPNNLLILTPRILEILRRSSPAPQSGYQTSLTVVTLNLDAASGYSRCFNILYKLVRPTSSFILAYL